VLGRVSLPWQVDAAERVEQMVADDTRKDFVVINVPPGAGKSTLFTHDIPVWLIARNRAIRIMVGSSTGRLAEQYGGRIRATLERKSPMRASAVDAERGIAVDALWTMAEAFGEFVPEARSAKWRSEQFTVQQGEDGPSLDDKEPTVSTWGADTQFLGGRFDFVIWDDLMTRKFRKPEAMEGLIETWDLEAETRVDPGGVFILQGQRLRHDDLYRYNLDKEDHLGEPKYQHIIYPAHDDDLCQGDHGPDAKPQGDGGCLLDPHRLPWRELDALRVTKPQTYAVVYQQQDGSPGATLVDPAWINGGIDSNGVPCEGCRDPDRAIGDVPPVDNLKACWSFVTVDPSPTQFWGIIWWLYDPVTKRRHIINMRRAQMKSTDFLGYTIEDGTYTGLLEEWAIQAAQLRIPIETVIFEVNAAQRWALQQPHVIAWGRTRQVRMLGHSTTVNKNDPKYGVEAIGPLFQQGLVRIPDLGLTTRGHMADLVNEVTHYPHTRTTDLVMATWFHDLAVRNHYNPRRNGGYSFNRPGRMARAKRGFALTRG
jgi:hypothetical protein